MANEGVATRMKSLTTISPKVYEPVIGQIVAGVVLILAGLDVEGKALLATALGTLGLGFRAKVGDTTAAPTL